jgi:hypothetical protein
MMSLFTIAAICQIRLDFDNFQIQQPTTTTGACNGDTITISSPSGKSPPVLCGMLTGTHSKLFTTMFVSWGNQCLTRRAVPH